MSFRMGVSRREEHASVWWEKEEGGFWARIYRFDNGHRREYARMSVPEGCMLILEDV